MTDQQPPQIIPAPTGLVGPDGQPVRAQQPGQPEQSAATLLSQVEAFFEAQKVPSLRSTVTLRHQGLGVQQVSVLAFALPSLMKIVSALKYGADYADQLTKQFRKEHAKATNERDRMAAIASKRRGMIATHIANVKVFAAQAKAIRAKATERIEALEHELENVIDACSSTEAGVLDDSRRVMEAATVVLKAKVTL